MPLTDKERRAAHAVVRTFTLSKEPTIHQALLREIDDPDVITRLTNAQVWTVDTRTTTSARYLPTILTFHYCGDDTFLAPARKAVEVVVRDVKNIFRVNYDQNKRYQMPGFLTSLESTDYVPVPAQIALGLFLAKDSPNIIFATLDDIKTSVVSFQISDHVLKQDPEKVWDNYVQQYDRISQEDRVNALAKQTTTGSPERHPAQRTPQSVSSNKTQNWLPSRWKIVGPLREGGQGWTYKVRRSTGADKTLYVLKRLKNKDRLHRFQREIAALTKLQHPGILRIIETSADSEEPFFVAEFCEGSDLSKANLSGLDFLPKLQIFRQVCDAIAAAHNVGILHRDLKPSNIFSRKDSSVAVGDFGLCLDLNDAKERATMTSEAVGARMYIAPEVEMGRVEEPEASSDVYSLGKVLYFILSTGTLMREDYAESAYDLRNQRPEMHFVYELFEKSIKRRPEDRFSNATDLLRALDSVIERVQMKAHVLHPAVEQRCMFCGVGEYRFSERGTDWMKGVCSRCGNAQDFIGAAAVQWLKKR